MNKAYLLLGGNLGNKTENLQKATTHIEKSIGKIVLKSSVYETAPWGFFHEESFLNQAVLVETTHNSQQLLRKIIEIELKMGRKRSRVKWQERTIDIDILFFNDSIIEREELKIPHPHMQERKFALIPLNELAPGLMHPIFKMTINELLQDCKDTSAVKLSLISHK